MAIIPQYRAQQGPAGRKAPVLEQQSSIRVDASEAVRGIARLSGAIGTEKIKQVDPNLGQGTARGLQAIGQGVNAVGGALRDAYQRVEDAKNYADEFDAQIAMDREVGEFEKWRIQSNDPTAWEGEWLTRMDAFGGKYFEGKNITPAATESIKRNIGAFKERRAIQVGVDAMRESVGRATNALQADVIRMTEAGELEPAIQKISYGVSQGWIPEDRGEMMKIQAKDQIETKQIEALQNQKRTALLYNDQALAMESIDAMPIREDEKALERASITEQFGYNALLRTGEDILDPKELLSWIDSDEASKLRPSDKEKFRNGAYQSLNMENSATISGLKEEIDLRGGITPSELEGRDDFNSLSDRDKEAVRQFVTKGVQNDIAEFSTLQRAIRGYEPNDDPRGSTRADLERSIALRFNGDRANELIQSLDEATNRTGPVTPSERVVSDVFTSLQKRYEAGEVGNFKVTGDMIREHTDENGVVSYVVPDPKGEIPANAPWLGRNTPQGRIINLTEDDILKFKSGKTDAGDIYEDQRAKQSAFSRFLNVQSEVEQKVKSGELTEPDEITNEVNRLLGGELEGAFDARQQSDKSGNALPSGSFGTISNGLFNPSDASEFIKNYSIGF